MNKKKKAQEIAEIVTEVMSDNIVDDVLVEPNKPVEVVTYKIGDVVRLVPGSTYTSGTTIPNSILNSKLYIRSVGADNTYTVGIQMTGKIAGAVKAENMVTYSENMVIPNPANAYLAIINEDIVHIKSRPDEKGKTLKTIHRNGLFTIVEEKDGWGHLKIGGWIPVTSFKKIGA